MGQCRSSGVKTASAAIFSGQCHLVSLHAVHTGMDKATATTVKVFDNASAASGTELARLVLGGPAPISAPIVMEYDMHGVLANNGLYLEITGSTAAVSVEFN